MSKSLEATETLDLFFECWKKQKWFRMNKYIQRTWRYNKSFVFLYWNILIYRSKPLRTLFKDKTLIYWKISNKKRIGGACTDFDIEIKFKINNTFVINKGTARLICEVAPYRPSLSGNWGVNPISVITAFGKVNNKSINVN